MTTDLPAPIRDAASIILVRDVADNPQILMGQRGAKAAFMPSKFVFPGGAVDPADGEVPFCADLGAQCRERLAQHPLAPVTPQALAGAAIRELWEEAGLRLARPGTWAGTPPTDWQGFAADGLCPDASALHFVFRAITPPKRPRRFDARFFLADANALHGDADDFSAASDELSHLRWIAIDDIGGLDLPFITEVILAEVRAHLPKLDAPARVPFFDNRASRGALQYL